MCIKSYFDTNFSNPGNDKFQFLANLVGLEKIRFLGRFSRKRLKFKSRNFVFKNKSQSKIDLSRKSRFFIT